LKVFYKNVKIFFISKTKSRNLILLNFIILTFCVIFKIVAVEGFSTPLDSINLTTVKFIESTPPQGGSYRTKASQGFYKM
jgi:hypothetical protein